MDEQRLKNIRAELNDSYDKINLSTKKLLNNAEQFHKIASVAMSADSHIEDINNQFQKATKLDKRDMVFLFTAIAMQCIRQYVIGSMTQREDHNISDKKAHELQEKLWDSDSDTVSQYRKNGARYRATTDEIKNSFSVPYDVTSGTKRYGVGGFDELGNPIGLGGTTHRYKTLGHDPLFGWIFGTSNIMTNTLTNNIGKTFHVKNSSVVSYGGYDKTAKMFEHVKQRSLDKPSDLGICVIKQGLHIASDTFSKDGIALPGTVKLNSELANTLSGYGIDLGNAIKVSEQASFSVLINQIIAMVHGLFYDKTVDGSYSLYSVKTRKILMYSNCIASMSNVIAVACGAIVGNATGNVEVTKKILNYLDVGGLIVTIHRIVSDKKFIYEVKKEFMEKQWYDLVMNELY